MLGGLNFGYTMAYSSPARESIFHDFPDDVDSVNKALFTASTSAWAILGPFITGALLHRVGRRPLTIFYGFCGAFFWLLFFLVKPIGFPFAIIVRCLCGLLIGATSALMPLYMVELAPPRWKSFFGTLNQLGISSGWVVCYGVATKVKSWLGLAGIGAGIPLLLGIGTCFIPESPAVLELEQFSVGDPGSTLLAGGRLPWLVVCALLMLFQQMTGVNIVLMNLTDNSEDPVKTSILPSLAQVVACFCGAFLIAKIGPRVIWFISCFGSGVADIVRVILEKNGKDTVIVTYVFLAFFGVGCGPIPWFFVPERFTAPVRATAMAIIATINWIFAFVVIVVTAAAWQTINNHRLIEYSVFGGFSLLGALFGLCMVFNPEDEAKEGQKMYPDHEIYTDLVPNKD
jgi:MFS family permease